MKLKLNKSIFYEYVKLAKKYKFNTINSLLKELLPIVKFALEHKMKVGH